VLALAALVAFIALPLLDVTSSVAVLAVVACTSLPLLALQIAPIVLLNRALLFGRLAAIEVVSGVAFYVFAVTAAIVGLGSTSLAGGVPVAALASLAAVTRVQPWSFGISLEFGLIRRLAPFGLKLSGIETLTLGREVLLVAVLAAIGGQALAGFYSMARRLLAVPYAVMAAVARVGFPALARIESGPARTRRAASAAALCAVAVGLSVALLFGAGDSLVANVFGARWLPSFHMVVPAAAGLLIFASAGGALTSLSFAEGRATLPLVAAVVQIVVTLGLCVVLVPGLDATGAGIAIGLGFALNTMVVALHHTAEARACLARAALALLVTAAAGGAGQIAGGGLDVPGLLVSSGVSLLVWLLLTWLLMRRELSLLWTLGLRNLPWRRSGRLAQTKAA
jgi:O-antigen/teichoic acid export membrane protein